MLILLYGVILILFWVRLSRIDLSFYPQSVQDRLHEQVYQRFNHYRRCAGFLLIWIVLAMGNGALAALGSHHHAWAVEAFKILSGFTAVYILAVLVFVAYKAWQHYRVWQGISLGGAS